MMPVHKYIDMENDTFRKTYDAKGDFGLWELLNFDARMLVMGEYLGDRVAGAIVELGDKLIVKKEVTGDAPKPVGDGKSGTVPAVPPTAPTKPEGK